MYLLGLRRPFNLKIVSTRFCRCCPLCQKHSWNRFFPRVCRLFQLVGRCFVVWFGHLRLFSHFHHFSVRNAGYLVFPFFNLIFIKIIIILCQYDGSLYFLAIGSDLFRYWPNFHPENHRSACTPGSRWWNFAVSGPFFNSSRCNGSHYFVFICSLICYFTLFA